MAFTDQFLHGRLLKIDAQGRNLYFLYGTKGPAYVLPDAESGRAIGTFYRYFERFYLILIVMGINLTSAIYHSFPAQFLLVGVLLGIIFVFITLGINNKLKKLPKVTVPDDVLETRNSENGIDHIGYIKGIGLFILWVAFIAVGGSSLQNVILNRERYWFPIIFSAVFVGYVGYLFIRMVASFKGIRKIKIDHK